MCIFPYYGGGKGKALKSKVDYFGIKMDLVSWKPLEALKSILTILANMHIPCVSHHLCEGHVRRCWAVSVSVCPDLSLSCRLFQEPLWFFLSLKLPPDLKPALTKDDKQSSGSDACLMLSDTNRKGVVFIL